MDQKSNAEKHHFRQRTTLHKRIPSKQNDEQLLKKVSNTHKSAKIRSTLNPEQINDLHEPVHFSWAQFWVTFLYENIPPVFLSPIVILLIERSRKKAWNVIQNRQLLAFSLKHNSKQAHGFSWMMNYPSNWLIHISLGLIWFQPDLLRNIDSFQVILAYLFLFIRNLIISIKYGYCRPEDYALLREGPPIWVEENTSRRLVGVG